MLPVYSTAGWFNKIRKRTKPRKAFFIPFSKL